MCSVTEPHRATVSCKNLFSSSANDRSMTTTSTPSPPSSSSRRCNNNNAHGKRNSNIDTNVFVRSSNYSKKNQQQQQQRLVDITNDSHFNSNVFQIPFSIEQTYDNGRKSLSNTTNNTKLLRTSLNPLSPAFFSTRQTSVLLSEQKQDVQLSHPKVVLLSETSDYGSSTDPELQSTQHISPFTESSPFTFDAEESSFNFPTLDSSSHPSTQTRRVSLSSSSSSSSSSSPTSPSSSVSNLSSLSSSSELHTNCENSNRLPNKKHLSITNYNNNTSNDMINCHCEKENPSSRKRNRINSYSIRRYTTTNTCETCQKKRTKFNSRLKFYSNRQTKSQRLSNRSYNDTPTPVKFTIDLTGLNVNYTIEYHDTMTCPCSTAFVSYHNSSCCKCSALNEGTSLVMMNLSNEYTNELYYVDISDHTWLQPIIPNLPNYPDFFLTKLHENNLPSVYLDDNALTDATEYIQPYYCRPIQPPPTRAWLRLASPNATEPTAIFTVMNYNILCDRYATRYSYGYCPSWALKWEYRRKQILDELGTYAADIIALQKLGYDGVFSPKSRAKTMCEQDRRFVDGCAIFYRQSKFRLIKDYLVEFNQLAITAANVPACHDMMNRVMTKDNIGLVALLETKEEIYSHSFSHGALPSKHKQMLFVCTAHIHWDPEYSDVKVVQTLMLLSELKIIMEDALQKHRTDSNAPTDCTSAPLVLCGDFNSLPDSGVIQLMRTGKISLNHADFKDLQYESYLQKISRLDMTSTPSTDIVHNFKLQSAYETTSSPIMPYTNYTYDFKGIIDYVFFSSELMRVLGVLGPLDPEWLQSNKIVGCPQPNVPSDHFPLLVEFELNPTANVPITTETSSHSTQR
ncbi:unnamed protein product [Adineta ricciae]|uniref:poly(A)-specific ribonuclease n=1 Tax=Adineta ricciae TaxID=249248 RepID=A0A813SPW4_ADIRI|nr:unnamed protein product [Adineta ricciae]